LVLLTERKLQGGDTAMTPLDDSASHQQALQASERVLLPAQKVH
jgi:hypothetical protein